MKQVVNKLTMSELEEINQRIKELKEEERRTTDPEQLKELRSKRGILENTKGFLKKQNREKERIDREMIMMFREEMYEMEKGEK